MSYDLKEDVNSRCSIYISVLISAKCPLGLPRYFQVRDMTQFYEQLIGACLERENKLNNFYERIHTS
jgi:hypothetical protein